MTKSLNQKLVRGFSLLEVLVAVVVLSTGLLALAALQSGLARSSADAKVRSRVAAALTTRMESLRAAGYNSTAMVDTGTSAPAPTTCNRSVTPATPAWLCDAESQSALGAGSLSVTQTVTTWATPGSGAFAVNHTPGAKDAQFKRVQLVAQWTDSAGDARRLMLSTDVSALGLEDSLLPSPDDYSVDGTRPIARINNPAAEAGVIPVAMSSTQQDTAATNPKPEIIGQGGNQSIVGTRFSVLTYTNLGSGVARLQKRIDNEVIRCRCKYGALTATANNGTPLVPQFMRTAQWPAMWNGTKYEVYKPDPAANAPGEGINAGEDPAAVGDQSENCTACCRDHHDRTTVTTAKFDPVRAGDPTYGTDQQSRYDRVDGQLVLADPSTNGTYLQVCRMILVDGVMRTAADMYSRHFGLLETQAASTDTTKIGVTGVPNTTKATEYGTFVKKALELLRPETTPVAPADNPARDPEPIYVTRGLAVTSTESIPIAAPRPVDERYLHARGLYLDELSEAARQKLADVLADTGTGGLCDSARFGTNKIECILPYLPFTTINLTELAFWQSEDTASGTFDYHTLANESDAVLNVQSASALIYNPAQPFRGRVNARSNPANTDGEAAASIGKSNSGVAISDAIDPHEQAAEGVSVDKQKFTVSTGSTPVNGVSFAVNLINLPQTTDTNSSNDPSVAWTTNSAQGNCGGTVSRHDADPNNYVCATSQSPIGPGSITVSNYWREYTENMTLTVSCSFNGTPRSVTATLAVPTFADYVVTGARYLTLGNASPQSVVGTFDSPQETNSGTRLEATRISFDPLPPALPPVGDPTQYRLDVSFGSPTIRRATVASCETNNNGTQVRNVVWNRSW